MVHGPCDHPHPGLELPEVPRVEDLLRHAAAGARQHHPHPAQGLHLTPQDGPVILQVSNSHTSSFNILFGSFFADSAAEKGAFQLLHKLSFHESIATIFLKRRIKDLRVCPCHHILLCISKHKGCIY